MKTIQTLTCAATIVALGFASNASAQAARAAPARAAAAPAAAATAPTSGPVIPGVCTFWPDRAIAQSSVGRFVEDRLKQIQTQVQAELQPEDTAIATDGRALEAKKSTLDAATFNSQVQALQARAQAFRQKLDLRQKELQATQEKATNRINQELQPIVSQLYQSRRCSILVNGEPPMVFYANPAMDITSEAVTGLNARIQQFAFDREHLDTAQPAAR
jgi:outer membrane protein